jgi:hypothetical protein
VLEVRKELGDRVTVQQFSALKRHGEQEAREVLERFLACPDRFAHAPPRPGYGRAAGAFPEARSGQGRREQKKPRNDIRGKKKQQAWGYRVARLSREVNRRVLTHSEN